MAATVAPQGKLAYLVTDDRTIHCYSLATGKHEGAIPAAAAPGRDMLGAAHHPLRNWLATWAVDGSFRMWAAASSAADDGDVVAAGGASGSGTGTSGGSLLGLLGSFSEVELPGGSASSGGGGGAGGGIIMPLPAGGGRG